MKGNGVDRTEMSTNAAKLLTVDLHTESASSASLAGKAVYFVEETRFKDSTA